MSNFFLIWESGTVMGISVFADRCFSNGIPFMPKITAKQFSVFLICCLAKRGQHTTDPFRRYKTMCSLLEMNQIQFPVTLNLLQLIQLQQLSQMRKTTFPFGKRFHHWACRYRILMVRSLLFIYE